MNASSEHHFEAGDGCIYASAVPCAYFEMRGLAKDECGDVSEVRSTVEQFWTVYMYLCVCVYVSAPSELIVASAHVALSRGNHN